MGDLKPGWVKLKFGLLAECVNDRVDDPSAAGVERYVGLEHLDPESLTIRRWGTPDQVESTKLRFIPGDIIFGKRRAYQRKLAVADFEGICSAHAMVLRAKSVVVAPEFLPFFMQSDLFMERAVKISVGSLSPTINWKTLAAQEFVLPPLDEQKRVVEQLRAWTALREAMLSAAQACIVLRRSYLINLFRSDRGLKDRFPPHWDLAAVANAGDAQLGQQRHPMFDKGTNMRPYLRVANVHDGTLDLSDVLTMHFPENSLDKFELRPGDILLNEGQSTELVGRSAIYRGEIPGACFQKTLLRFRCGPRLTTEFAHCFFQHMLYTGQFARMVVQTTSTAHLTGVRFAKLPIPIPPIKEQREIAEQLAQFEIASHALSVRLVQASYAARKAINEGLGL